VPGVAAANVDLLTGVLVWTNADSSAPADLEAVKGAIVGIGFEAQQDDS
jgi:hypothetical protein